MPDFNISAIRNKTKSRYYARAELMFYWEFFYYTTSSYRIRCGFFNKDQLFMYDGNPEASILVQVLARIELRMVGITGVLLYGERIINIVLILTI